MGLGDIIDGAIAPFAPALAARRMSARIGLNLARNYDAAERGRRTQGWKRPATSADAENARAIAMLRNSGNDLVRNNKYAAAGVRQIVTNMIGDGISPQFDHDDKSVARKAQAAWDGWAEGKVDGKGDFYEHQKLTARGMVTGGETLTRWSPDSTGPDGRIVGLEGDFLDASRLLDLPGGGRIVQGVEYDAFGDVTSYWLFDRHPGDVGLTGNHVSAAVSAIDIDHVFERLRFGQSRGVSWLSSVAMTLRDIGDIEDAVRMQQKVQACLGLIITPGEGNTASPLSQARDPGDARRPPTEALSPGMVFRAQPGETVTSLNPTQSGGAVEFIRQQLAAVSANMAPYHLMTGDVSQANYSSLRAAMLGHWSLLDDWQQHVMIPHHTMPAVKRRMRRLAIETGDKRFLDLRIGYALPVRRFVDPIKDLMGELIEIRSGLKTLARSLAERGINAEAHLAKIAEMNKQIDALGLALDSDPRRLTDAGVLQLAAGYIAPKTEAAAAA
ncbi:phage portal protein [Sphingomonas sp. CROZ-RG-20F-R02-07]|uniref:phage portal protein n=1 Tax=Sphingomonas sp. CROZ-RG-20F-R02-07 TaxID=2914832 RepID=UPI001F561578|nr:phage portal protein [Sphingomonas sp. CROZ-RG-20F-R02-07]